MSGGFWYLATPYSKYALGREAAYQEACKQTALLVKAKVPVFCPIAHTHGPGETGIVENDLETWLVADRPFMDAAKGLIICGMDGWSVSAGIAAEIDVFQAACKPIIYMSPGIVPWRLLSLGHEEAVAASTWCTFDGSAWKQLTPWNAAEEKRPMLGPDLDADGEPECPQDDSAQRKATPLCTGVLDYFPDALAAVARVSQKGNDKHNPGEPLHWSREKSADHADCILRHMADRGKLDTDGELHDAKVAWRALAQLQLAEEKRESAGCPKKRGCDPLDRCPWIDCLRHH